jgi:signal transduction histidine kinase
MTLFLDVGKHTGQSLETVPGKLEKGADDAPLLRVLGLALPAAILVLGAVSPRSEGLSASFLVAFTGLIAGLVILDQTSPGRSAPVWRRLLWISGELAFCFFIVRVHGNLVRPALIYLLPVSRSLVMFGERPGLGVSLSIWLVYSANLVLALRPDRLGEYRNYALFLLAPYVLTLVLTLATIRQAADRHRVERLYAELNAAHQQLKALHEQAREAAVTQERNRLARDIHDILAHYLTVINIQLEASEKLAGIEPERALEHVQRARRLALECLREARRSVAALRAATLEELSLPVALKRLATEFSESTGIRVQLALSVPDDVRLPQAVALALYRAAQEALTNIHKHARATTAHLTFSTDSSRFLLTIEDDGVGPPEENKTDHEGIGLLGLRERVDLLGGTLNFGPGHSGGSRLSVVLPTREAR